jgi:hypothetical protein
MSLSYGLVNSRFIWRCMWHCCWRVADALLSNWVQSFNLSLMHCSVRPWQEAGKVVHVLTYLGSRSPVAVASWAKVVFFDSSQEGRWLIAPMSARIFSWCAAATNVPLVSGNGEGQGGGEWGSKDVGPFDMRGGGGGGVPASKGWEVLAYQWGITPHRPVFPLHSQ